ncbi:hypothetical protein HID58_042631 [Brassica napus]|uniref:Uncharacterized protein n=1 Tax=Brassica napus TaxID=3708 RepID=A0ABQ8BFL2_BRANA|nr:hypothetical protein HID58_042631 [Brassica napus]
MANSFVLLADLNAGHCSFTFEVRLLWSWKARNVKSCGKLMDQHRTGVVTTTSYTRAGSSVGCCQLKILNIREHNYPGGDMPSATCITCNFSDSEKTATDQITGGDDNLSNHPGASDAIAAAEQPISGGSNAEERLVPAAENALKSTHGLVA